MTPVEEVIAFLAFRVGYVLEAFPFTQRAREIDSKKEAYIGQLHYQKGVGRCPGLCQEQYVSFVSLENTAACPIALLEKFWQKALQACRFEIYYIFAGPT